MKRVIFIMLIMISLLTACSDGTIGNPTAKEILRDEPDADILQYEGLIYQKIVDDNFLPNIKDLVKYEELGEIKKTKDSYWGFNDLNASKLPVGTKVFSTNEGEETNYHLIIELDGEDIHYFVLLEG